MSIEVPWSPQEPASLRSASDALATLRATRQVLENQHERDKADLAATQGRLDIYPRTAEALEVLSSQLFERLIAMLEEKLTIALQEVLGQPLKFRAELDTHKRAGSEVRLFIERDSHEENIMKGTGGSVSNVLSVGLRLFALATLDPAKHARVLILDEPDCWLRPDLVPRLVKIIADASKAMGFQVIMISHHDLELFRQYADRIVAFEPVDGTVRVRHIDPRAEPGQHEERPLE